jgi:hypothetical protein
MSLPNNIPTIIVGDGNWGIKQGNLLGYSQSDYKLLPREFAVTRGGGTNGTFVGSNGLIQTAASGNVPRIDFTGGLPALLVEPAATNLFSGSVDLGNTTYWSRPAGANVTGNVSGIIAPDGTQTATLFQASGTTATNSRLRQTWSRTTTGAHAMSVFVRGFPGVAASGMVFCGVGNSELNFAITSGGVVTLTSMTGGAEAVTSGIVNYGNGWYRLTAVGTAATSGSTQSELYCSPSGGPQYYVWGAQMEVGSVATSYIPTTTGSVTRNNDVITLTSATDYIGQTEGTIYLELEFKNVAAAQLIFLDVGGVSQYIRITKNASNAINVLVLNTSGSQSLFTSSSNPVGTYKLAFAYKSGDNAMSINGAAPLTSANTSNYPTSSLSRIVLSDSMVGFNPLNGRIRAVVIYPTRLPNDQLQALTTL